MDIEPKEIVLKKVVGKLGKASIVRLSTVGGLELLVLAKPVPEVLGVSSHPAISRFLVQKKHPDAVFNELSKSEDVDPSCFEKELLYWQEISDKLNLLLK